MNIFLKCIFALNFLFIEHTFAQPTFSSTGGQSALDLKITIADRFEGPLTKSELLAADSLKLNYKLNAKYHLNSFSMLLKSTSDDTLFYGQNKLNGHLTGEMDSAILSAPAFSWIIFSDIKHSYNNKSKEILLPVSMRFLLINPVGHHCPCDSSNVGKLISEKAAEGDSIQGIEYSDRGGYLAAISKTTDGTYWSGWKRPESYHRDFFLERVIKLDAEHFVSLRYQYFVSIDQFSFVTLCYYSITADKYSKEYKPTYCELNANGELLGARWGPGACSQEQVKNLIEKYK